MGNKLSEAEALALVETFEREELIDALVALRAVLDGHGLEKHGVARWRSRTTGHIEASAERHSASKGNDPESGYPHRAHEVVRRLMLLQLELEGRTA